MAYDPIAARYARAAFELAQSEGKTEELLHQLQLIAQLCSENPDLSKLMNNPDVDPPDKVGIIQRLLKGIGSEQLQHFLSMVIERGRAEYLPQIAEAFLAEVDAQRGRLRVVVRSPRPLADEAMDRLKSVLEKREKKQILMETETAPELIAGVQLVMGHRVVDGSIQRQLKQLRERLSSVRVFENTNTE